MPPPDLDAGEVVARDGRTVARGGAGQRIPGFLGNGPREANGLGGRRIYFDLTSSTLAPLNADVTTATTLQSDLDAADLTEAQN